MQYFVYILKCSDGSFYTGLSNNLKRRLKEHEEGKSVNTKNLRPIELVFYSCFKARHLAAEFEQYLKTHSGIAFRNKHLVSTTKRSAEV